MSSQPQQPGGFPGQPPARHPSTAVPVPGATPVGVPPVVLGTAPDAPPVQPQPQPRPAPTAPIPHTAQPDVDPREPQFRRFPIPVSTTDALPGFEVAGIVGVVVGVVTRPRDLAHHPDMAFVNASARQDAIDAMVAQAVAAGADGVIGLGFDGGKISENVSEITAYGTAVRIRR